MSAESTVVVGRERELAAARRLLDEAVQRPAGLVLTGEAGIGKTTVWSAIVEHAAADGFAVLVARPAEAEVELAFGVLIDLFGELSPEEMPELPEVRRVALDAALRRSVGGAAVDPSSVALAVSDVLAGLARTRPVLVAIDDVQWADSSSVRVLDVRVPTADRRARRARHDAPGGSRGRPRRARGTRRRRPRADRPGRTRRASPRRARLRPQRSDADPPAGRAHRGALAREPVLRARARGVDPSGETLPESLTGALRTRLAALSPTARAVALTAATLGRFDESLHSTVHRQGLEELRATSVVVVRDGVPTFAHPLLASTLLEMHTSVERRAVHASLARVLDDPDERALHLGRGARHASEDVAAELEAAADRLTDAVRRRPRRSSPSAPRRSRPRADPAASTQRLLKASDLYQAAGEASEHVLPLLEPLAASLPAGPDRARVLVRLGWLGAQQGTMTLSESIAYQEQALDEAGGAGDVTSAAHAVLARLCGNNGDYREALVHAERAGAGGETIRGNMMFPSPAGESAPPGSSPA